jgi:hypothetical protein
MWSSLRSRTVKASAAVLLVVAVTSLVGVAAPPGPKFSLGVLRRDGLLVPFATFDGRGWSVPWPDSDVNVPLPISIDDVPKKWWGAPGPGVPWTAWIRDADPRPLKLTKPVHVSVFCGGHVALTTDYHGGPIDPKEPTVPKDGLAIAGDVKPAEVFEVSVHSPDAKKLIDAITDDFNEEEALAAKHFTAWKHPFSAEQRTQYPIELEAFYRTSQSTTRGTWRTSYIEAVRKFPASAEDQGCGLITFVRGWVTEQQAPKKPVINLGARVTYCDRAEVSFMLPFGRLAIDKEFYWVYQISSWRNEMYTVARVGPDDVVPVVVASGGGCRRDSPRH